MRKTVVGKRRILQRAKQEFKKVSINTFRQPPPPTLIQPAIVLEYHGGQETYNISGSSASESFDDITPEFSSDDSDQAEVIQPPPDASATSILENLKSWAFEHSVNHTQLTALLKILKVHDCFSIFPADSRTLIKQLDICVPTEIVPPGEYVHFGLTPYVRQILQLRPNLTSLQLQVNIDGLQIYKSCQLAFWPILGYFCGLECKPFVIGAYCGSKKPESVDNYLQKFIRELIELIHTSCKLEVQCFVCDAPAKSFIKAIKGHNGYHGCDKCYVVGKSINRRMSYFDTNKALRSDSDFRNLKDTDHHTSTTCLTEIPRFDMINGFPIDYMHLVCLGVVKKLLKLWTTGKPKDQKLSSFQISKISEKLKESRKFTPSEFSRKPRPLEEIDRWKATEFRHFLLYTGPIILKRIISSDNYRLFLSLSIAIRILCSSELHVSHNSYAKSLLVYFVQGFKSIYGEDRVSYNIHGLVHLTEDVKRFGILDKFSAFKFENKLGSLRKLVRTPNLPLQQLKRRLLEKDLKLEFNQVSSSCLSNEHSVGPLTGNIIGSFRQFTTFSSLNFKINCKLYRDTFCLTKENILFRVVNILQIVSSEVIILIGYKYQNLRSLFTEPCSSKLIQIFVAGEPDYELSKISTTDILYKCQVFPTSGGSAVFPLIHQF
ncbi:hypothetical protein Fcan01_13034 [Folsomia candida]|uniref:Transposase domain-containing protein n=1 Tax=Folsomia candida TaxID=158441 RepID=A0A226E422_FOLCA|nr:hypothetical protein Fcan01_13034 [Folsomia candida]